MPLFLLSECSSKWISAYRSSKCGDAMMKSEVAHFPWEGACENTVTYKIRFTCRLSLCVLDTGKP